MQNNQRDCASTFPFVLIPLAIRSKALEIPSSCSLWWIMIANLFKTDCQNRLYFQVW
jgi:hypothetical protein